jgi:hypothetical protein
MAYTKLNTVHTKDARVDEISRDASISACPFLREKRMSTGSPSLMTTRKRQGDDSLTAPLQPQPVRAGFERVHPRHMGIRILELSVWHVAAFGRDRAAAACAAQRGVVLRSIA